MKRPQLIRSSSSLFVFLILIIAAIDYQSWALEQIYLLTGLSMQVIFSIEAVILGLVSILMYRWARDYFQNTSIATKLSDREQEVLQNILSGKTNREIEQKLFIEKSTLKSHINRIYRKLDVADRKDLISRYSGT